MPLYMAQFAYTPQAWTALDSRTAGPRGRFRHLGAALRRPPDRFVLHPRR